MAEKPGPIPTDSKWEPIIDPETGKMDVGGLVIPPTSTVTGLLYGFGNHPENKAKFYYFWRLAAIFWDNPELPEPILERNPWAEKIVWEFLENKYLSIGGAASSTKSHTMAAVGLISWLSKPKDTLVLVTSTALQEARKRIWGSVLDLLTRVEGAPCKIRDSIGSIAYIRPNGQLDSRAGLSLIAAEKSRTKEATEKLIGVKKPNIILIADELSELSPAIVATALANLSKNKNLRIIGMSNPASRFDAFGVWSEPKDGWDSVDVMTADFWDTKWGGKYIRLDGERSPNIVAGENLYEYLPTEEKLEEDRKLLGRESRAYMRMVRAIFFDSDEAEGIYTRPDLIGGPMNGAEWQSRPERVAGLDPGFTNGGDRTVLYTALVGYAGNGQYALEFERSYPLNDDAKNKAVPRSYQIVEQVVKLCQKLNIAPENLAVDATGAGGPFCDILAGEWASGFLRVGFGGKASDKRVSANSSATGEELYMNRVTELWFVGKELIRTKQIFGITPELAEEMVGRKYDMRKVGTLRMVVEPKEEFRRRLGRSPDLADAAFLALDIARHRFGLLAAEPPEMDGPAGFQRMPRPRRSLRSMAEALVNPEGVLP